MRPIIRQRLDNGETRPAIRAIDKRVAITPVLRIKKLCQAIIAGGEVGRDKRCLRDGGIVGKANLKTLKALERNLADVNPLHLGSRGRLLRELHDKLVNERLFPLDMDVNAVRRVQNPPVHKIALCKPIHKGTEPHALDNAVHMQTQRAQHIDPFRQR